MKKSITTKLFLAVFLFFSFFVVVTMVMQTLFFKKFYTQRKIYTATEAANSFRNAYEKYNWSDDELNKKMSKFITQNNAMMVVTDKFGNVKNLNSLKIEIKSDSNKTIIVPLKNIADCRKLEKISSFIGKTVSMDGTYISKVYFNPYYISSDALEWSMLLPPRGAIFNSQNIVLRDKKYSSYIVLSYKLKSESYADISTSMYSILSNAKHLVGKMSFVNSINNEIVNDNDLYRVNILIRFISKWFGTNLKLNESKFSKNSFIQYMSGSTNLNEDSNIIFTGQISIGKSKKYIFIMESLKPVNEVLDIMNQYYIYFLFIAFFLILALALLFAKMISNPLIKINNVAVKMADMNFSEHIKVNSDDEIGTLSRSINTLSDNLQINIDGLKKANEILKKDIEKERKIEELRKEFIASASHELKTPISVIKSFSEGIADGISQEKQKHYIDVILKETEKMNSLVMDMLELSKLESGNYKLVKENFDICSLIHNVVHKFAPIMNEKGLEVVYNLSHESIIVNADKGKIEEVIDNIISNTVKYAWNNHKIYISANKNESNIEISIENEGDKIPEDKINRVWERFYRVEESRNKKTGGTGLGLSIVKNILELHESTYGVINTENGVKFNFTLP